MPSTIAGKWWGQESQLHDHEVPTPNFYTSLPLYIYYLSEDWGMGKAPEKCWLLPEWLVSPALKFLYYLRPIIILVYYDNRWYLLYSDKAQFVDQGNKAWEILSMENTVG